MSELTNALSPLFTKGDDKRKKTVLAQTEPCWLCDDCDILYQVVCYLPNDNGCAKDIPIHHCPVCGRQLEEV